jgi:hypothetical protein
MQTQTLKKIVKKIKRTKLSLSKATGASKQEELSARLGKLEKEKKELLQDSQAEKVSKNFDKLEKAAKIQEFFTLPDKQKAFVPLKVIPTDRDNVFADERVADYYPSNEELQGYIDEGQYILILKNSKPKPQAIAIPVLFETIQEVRSQRFRILDLGKAQLGKEEVLRMQCAIITNAVEKIDKRITNKKKLIDKYLEEFLASRNPETIASDLAFLCKIL